MPDANARQADGGEGRLKDLARLTRLPLTAMVTGTCAAGYLLATAPSPWRSEIPLDWRIVWPVAGVWLLGCGASALNQAQESRIDSRMERTRTRPVAAGRMDRGVAAFLGLLLVMGGLYCLASGRANQWAAVGLGAFCVLWYNGVYTYLKRVTAYAVLPGALLGAIPPVIGFASAGGPPRDAAILTVAAFYLVWQAPHFWLLVLVHGGDYARAGLPSLVARFSPAQLARITFAWLAAVGAMGAILPARVEGWLSLPAAVAVWAASAWVVLGSLGLLRPRDGLPADHRLRRAFARINVYGLIVTLALASAAF